MIAPGLLVDIGRCCQRTRKQHTVHLANLDGKTSADVHATMFVLQLNKYALINFEYAVGHLQTAFSILKKLYRRQKDYQYLLYDGQKCTFKIVFKRPVHCWAGRGGHV